MLRVVCLQEADEDGGAHLPPEGTEGVAQQLVRVVGDELLSYTSG